MGFQTAIDWCHSSMQKSWSAPLKNAETVTRQDDIPAGLKTLSKGKNHPEQHT
jgi:hypothetical protein